MSNRTGEQLAALERLLHLYQVKSAVLSMPAGRLHEFPEEVRRIANAHFMAGSKSTLKDNLAAAEQAVIASGFPIPPTWRTVLAWKMSGNELRALCEEMLVAVLHLETSPAAVAAPTASGGKAEVLPSSKSQRSRSRGATVNAKLMDLFSKDPSAQGLSSRQLADKLNCSPPAIVNTAAWKALSVARGMTRLDRDAKRQRRWQGEAGE